MVKHRRNITVHVTSTCKSGKKIQYAHCVQFCGRGVQQNLANNVSADTLPALLMVRARKRPLRLSCQEDAEAMYSVTDEDRAVAQAVVRRHPTTATQVSSHVRSRSIAWTVIASLRIPQICN
jgi:hypothetical protein